MGSDRNGARSGKLKLNAVLGLINQAVTVAAGLILPGFYLQHFGSEVNGLVSSISQFLGLIAFLEFGVGAVIQSALYRPLAEKNELEINQIMIAGRAFFRKIAVIMGLYSMVVIAAYPLWIARDLDYFSTAFLILAISFSYFLQYYFGLNNQLLLSADQKLYIQYISQIIVLTLNVVLSILIMDAGGSIQVVKIVSSTVFAVRPLILSVYVKKHYRIDYGARETGNPIPQKWNGLMHHIAYVIVENADIVVLTLFSTLTNVSIYYVYYLVAYGIRQLISSVATGIQAFLGNIWVSESRERFEATFEVVEWGFHTACTLFFAITGLLIVPFISVYTKSITDANYIAPGFAYVLVAAQFIYCVRLPYYFVVRVAGHFKETQNGAAIEAVLNIAISIALVKAYGLIGVAIGTAIAVAFRAVYFANYLRRHILFRPMRYFFARVGVDVLSCAIMIATASWIKLGSLSYLSWLAMAVKVGLLCGIETLVLNTVFYPNYIKKAVTLLRDMVLDTRNKHNASTNAT